MDVTNMDVKEVTTMCNDKHVETNYKREFDLFKVHWILDGKCILNMVLP